jgi:membrane protease YdiL (CAAX protease family)
MRTLSETELAARHPEIAVAVALLFFAGLVADVYVLLWWARAKHERRRLQQVAAKPWDLLFLAVATAAFFGLMLVAQLPALFLPHDRASTNVILIAFQMVMQGGLLTGLWWWFRQRRISWAAAFGSVRSGVGTGAVVYLALFPVLFLLTVLQERLCRLFQWKLTPQPIPEMFITTDSTAVVALLTVFALVIAPVVEEIYFRGLAYPALKQRLGPDRALLVVSAVFALIHCHVPSLVPLFGLALGLGVAYEISGSLAAPITLHVLFNAANLGLLWYVRLHP